MSEDTISRQAAIDAINALHEKPNAWLDSAVDAVMTLPSAERKKGKWIAQKGGGYCCSECGSYSLDKVDGAFVHVSVRTRYCHNCGSYNESDDNVNE